MKYYLDTCIWLNLFKKEKYFWNSNSLYSYCAKDISSDVKYSQENGVYKIEFLNSLFKIVTDIDNSSSLAYNGFVEVRGYDENNEYVGKSVISFTKVNVKNIYTFSSSDSLTSTGYHNQVDFILSKPIEINSQLLRLVRVSKIVFSKLVLAFSFS